MGRSWLIKVNSTMYNILGGVREFGAEIPWYFRAGAQLAVGDIVFFYLTDSKERENKYKYSVVDSMFKRFLFKGEIIGVSDKILKDDIKYWNDNEYRKRIESENHEYAKIRITEVLYDYNIKSEDVAKEIWKVENAKKDVYELDPVMVSSIQTQIQIKSNR